MSRHIVTAARWPRHRITVMLELDEAKRRLASNVKTAEITEKPTTRALCDKLADSLRGRIATLEAELKTAPEPPPRAAVHGVTLPDGATLCRSVAYRTTPFSEAEIAEFGNLDIPLFLRRGTQ